VVDDMTTDPDQIRARIDELLGGHADAAASDPTASDLDALAARLEQAHDVLVRALESVEKG
jgi:hypothetical protein